MCLDPPTSCLTVAVGKLRETPLGVSWEIIINNKQLSVFHFNFCTENIINSEAVKYVFIDPDSLSNSKISFHPA